MDAYFLVHEEFGEEQMIAHATEICGLVHDVALRMQASDDDWTKAALEVDVDFAKLQVRPGWEDDTGLSVSFEALDEDQRKAYGIVYGAWVEVFFFIYGITVDDDGARIDRSTPVVEWPIEEEAPEETGSDSESESAK
jgi:hypothetical protein